MTNQEFIESIRLEKEEWRPVVGYEGLYVVSSFGRIASMKMALKRGRNGVFYRQQRLLKPVKMTIGYLAVSLTKNGKVTQEYLHRLVSKAFLPNPNNYPQIDHIDGSRDNNMVTNLKWCTGSQNVLNPITRIRNSSSKKSKQKRREKVVCIRNGNVERIYDSPKQATIDGFDHSCVVAVCNNKQKSHHGCQFVYLSDYEKTLTNQDVKEPSCKD